MVKLDSYLYKTLAKGFKMPINHIFRLLLSLIWREEKEISNQTITAYINYYVETLKNSDERIRKSKNSVA
jgi:hypothetical protein